MTIKELQEYLKRFSDTDQVYIWVPGCDLGLDTSEPRAFEAEIRDEGDDDDCILIMGDCIMS